MKHLGRLEITTKIGCKCNCLFCPQQLLIKRYFGRNLSYKPDTIMSMETFEKCISKIPEGTRIDFSGMVEPWLNSNCTNMLLLAHEKGFPIAVYSTLIGMKKEDFDLIREIPFEEFVIHIPDDKSNAHIEVTDDYISLLEQVVTYEQSSGNKLITGVSCHAGIHPDLLNLVPENSKLITEIIDRAGNIENENAKSKFSQGEIVCINCEEDFNHNVLLPDGTMLLCCMDYGMKHILGNLLFETYEEILNSKETLFIRQGLKDESKDILCRKCVNAKNVNEMYDEYILYKDWVRNLQNNDADRRKELNNYIEWVNNLEKTNKIEKKELQKANEQYKQRVKELEDYKIWVNNLENTNKLKDEELQQINTQYAQRIKELNDYKNWVSNLELQITQLQQKHNISLSTLDEKNKELSACKDQVSILCNRIDEKNIEIKKYNELIIELKEKTHQLSNEIYQQNKQMEIQEKQWSLQQRELYNCLKVERLKNNEKI